MHCPFPGLGLFLWLVRSLIPHLSFSAGYRADDRSQQVSESAMMILRNAFDSLVSPDSWFCLCVLYLSFGIFIECLIIVLLQSSEGVGKHNYAMGSNVNEIERSCELEFGSYCLWSREHREVLKDSIVKRLKDQLFVARSYYPSIAKLKGQENLTRELKLNIQNHERMLSEAVSDPELPPL
ncbi:hypothetical protein BHM03_00028442 [Ensete ventricosum]|nr:hypothetical protein BHM03_00028442 [Ensete ventricosum]